MARKFHWIKQKTTIDMKKLLSVIFLFAILGGVFAQDSLEIEFDKARVLLAQRKIEDAIVSLRKVYVQKEDNANINFLMGAAYTELEGTQSEALFHLKKAVQNVNEKYIIGSFKEEGAPIHVYYYLTLALGEVDSCAEANRALQEFKKYSHKVDQYFIDEAGRHLQKCPFEEEKVVENWNQPVDPPEDYDPKHIEVESFTLDSAALAERGLLTKRLEYTTNAPLYGVQIGSNINPSPTSSYSNAKNVDVFIDNKGIIRYVIGHFAIRSQAERLLKTLQEKGYTDAFVVNVNDERKYSNEVISYRNINLRAGIRGSVEYFIQLGAFKEEVPEDFMRVYTQIDDILELEHNKMTVIAVGPFGKFDEAQNKMKEGNIADIKDAFIVAYNKGKRIPLDEAKQFTD